MLCSSARTLSIASKMVCVNQGEKTNGVASTMKQWLLETSCLRTAAVISKLLAECWQGDCGSADNKIVGLQMFIGANSAFWEDRSVDVLFDEGSEVVIR